MPMTETPPGDIAGRSVLVTGGGSGIGYACAERLVRDGAVVTICGRDKDRLEAAARRIAPQAGPGGGVHFIAGDVTDEASVQAVVAKALEATGQLDACIANAGGGGALAPYHAQDTGEFLRVLHLNVLGVMLCVKHTAKHLVRSGSGAFVAMSSIAGHLTHPHFGAYCVGKAGIEAMMRNCADEFGPSGVRFNAIRPGFIATEIMEAVPRDSATYRSYIENTPLGDVGQPEDVAHLARFLIGPESRWVTGACINVDGGHHLRRGPDFSPFVVATATGLRPPGPPEGAR